MKIPVIINNRDLLTWPKAMVERISKYDNVGDIIIVDNYSSNKELLNWYATNPCKIFFADYNRGHTAPWDFRVVQYTNSSYYVVTDSDMGLENTPDNTLVYLKDKMDKLGLDKLGLGLNWQIVKQESPYYHHLQGYEKTRWEKSPIIDGIATNVAIDTTFAMYKVPQYFIGGGSTTFPYVARHLPWELTKEEYESNEEFKYYIQNATYSSSYKSFLKL